MCRPPVGKTPCSGSDLRKGHPMYTGTLINDLLDTVDRICNGYASLQKQSATSCIESAYDSGPAAVWETRNSEAEKFTQPLGLGATDRNLGLLLVVHPQLVRTLEPGDHFADTVDVHEVGAVGSPK